MGWIFFAIFSRFLWAACNALDQLVSRAHTTERTMAALILGLLCMAPFTVLSYCLSDGVLPRTELLMVMVGGAVCTIIGMVPYYYMLRYEQSYNLTPYMELTPVCLTLIAYLVLGETLNLNQAFAAFLIIGSGFLFSWDFEHGRFKLRALFLIFISCMMWALYQFSAKLASDEVDHWMVVSVLTAAEVIIALLLLAVMPAVRRSIVDGARTTKGASVAYGIASAAFAFTALASLTYAFQLAPSTGLVAALSGTQPILAFLLAIPLGLFWGKHFDKVQFNRATLLKLPLLGTIAFGVYLLAAN